MKKDEEDITLKRLILERRFFLTKSNTKWISIGFKALPSGEFMQAIRLFDSKGYFISINSLQFDRIFRLIREIPEIEAKMTKPKNDKNKKSYNQSPLKSIELTRSDYCSQVYILRNELSENAKEMALGLSTIERLLQLEFILKKIYDSLELDDVYYALAVLEHQIRVNLKEPEDETQFRSLVKDALINVSGYTGRSVLKLVPKHSQHDFIWQAFFDLAANFNDYVVEHIIYEKQSRMKNPNYKYLTDLMLNVTNNG